MRIDLSFRLRAILMMGAVETTFDAVSHNRALIHSMVESLISIGLTPHARFDQIDEELFIMVHDLYQCANDGAEASITLNPDVEDYELSAKIAQQCSARFVELSEELNSLIHAATKQLDNLGT